MPNYFVTNTARFNPFSYQELALPLMQATEAQYALEDVLSTVDDGTLETYLAGEDSNSPYRERYNSLTDRLQAASNELASRGLNPTLMREVKALRGDYNRFKTPVETAGKRKAQDVAAYNKAYLSDPSLIGDNPSDRDLQWYIDHPDYSPKYTSGDKLMAKGMLLGKEFASNFTPTMTPVMGGKYYEMRSKRTATMRDIQTDKEYRNAVDTLMVESGFNPEATDTYTQQARRAIEVGIYNSMQDPGLEYKTNPGYVSSQKTDEIPSGWSAIPGREGTYKLGGTEENRTVMRRDADGTISYVTDSAERDAILKEIAKTKPSQQKEDKNAGYTGSVIWDNSNHSYSYKPIQVIKNNINNTRFEKNYPKITILDDNGAKERLNNVRDTKGKYEEGYYYGETEDGTIIKMSKEDYTWFKSKLKNKFIDKIHTQQTTEANPSVDTTKRVGLPKPK